MNLLAHAGKGVFVTVNTAVGARWNILLGEHNAIHSDRIAFPEGETFFRDLRSVEIPEHFAAGKTGFSNDVEACFNSVRWIKGLKIVRSSINQGPYKGECLYVSLEKT
ncbi:hypothetical protein [Nevskia soli]|uniref:hypothetical protein n=1 Tax=Nevskia soli TaxID=418856 RepID=UPI0012F89A12|nr:hypothetical protein [Nevskia soli]